MDFKLCLVVLLVAIAMVAAAESSKIHDASASWGIRHSNVGDVIGDDNEMLMASETDRRQLVQRGRFISYEALKKNVPPCGQHGRSYYDCSARQRANPYSRGCSRITHCERRMRDTRFG